MICSASAMSLRVASQPGRLLARFTRLDGLGCVVVVPAADNNYVKPGIDESSAREFLGLPGRFRESPDHIRAFPRVSTLPDEKRGRPQLPGAWRRIGETRPGREWF